MSFHQFTSTLSHVIDKRNKASNLMLTFGAFALEELAQVTKVQKEKAGRKEGNWHNQKFGVIYIREGKHRRIARNVAEDIEDEKKAARDEKRKNAKYAKEERRIAPSLDGGLRLPCQKY